MPERQILVYPDERLRRIAEPVRRFDDTLKQLVADMAETMYAAPGIGLAAIQVDVPQRVVVIDLSEEKNALHVFINPGITSAEGRTETEEGCLSVPGVFAEVARAERVIVTAQDVNGDAFELAADGMLAVCIQHEIDHLNGRVFVDYLSRMKQERVKKRLKKEHHANEPQAA